MFDLLTSHQFRVPLLILILMTQQACVAAHYSTHPGSLNRTDSMAYDSLLVAETIIDQTRTANETARLSERAKDALNALIDAYNVARALWLDYRDALSRNAPADVYAARLATKLADLANAIRAAREVR